MQLCHVGRKSAESTFSVEMGKKKKRGGAKGRPHANPNHSRAKKSSKDVLEADNFVVAKNRKGKSFPVPGLSNLGNTCFFNSVMQNVSQSHYFRSRLDLLMTSPTYSVELKLPLSETAVQLLVSDKPGQLTEKLHAFLSQMHQAAGGGRTLNPKPVFSEICKQASRFSGYHQQDSQELLRYLLDSLRSEEITRIKRAILSSLKVGDKETRRKLTEDDRKDIRAYGIQAQLAPTFVDDVFGGTLRSTVVCEECENRTTVHETFLDLSLPIPEDKNMKDELISSPGGYQTRSKAKRNKGGRGGGGGGSYDERAVDETGGGLNASRSQQPKELSKHQLKKAKKQQEKQARKAAKQANRKSLQEFLKANDANPSSDPTKSEVQEPTESQVIHEEAREEEEEHPVTEEVMAEETQTETQPGGGGESSDSRTREVGQAQGMEDCEESVETGQQQPAENIQTPKMSSEDYVKEGPKPDCEEGSVKVEKLAADMATVSLSQNNSTSLPDNASEPQATTPEHSDIHQTRSTDDMKSLTSESPLSPPTVDTCASSNSNPGCERSGSLLESDPVKNKPSSIELLVVEADSLEASFKKFCTPELLTGSNKFACAVCTKKKLEQQMQSPSHFPSDAPIGDVEESVNEHSEETNQEGELPLQEDTNETSETDSSRVERTSVEVEEEEEEEMLSTVTNGKDEVLDTPLQHSQSVSDQEESLSNGPVLSTTQDPQFEDGTVENDDSVMGGDTERSPSPEREESDHHEETENGGDHLQDTTGDQSIEDYNEEDEVLSEEEEESKKKGKKSSTVFCDATKQLLIERPPLLLTLHMKRFLQHGRRLRKNNRYVSFPTLLNIAPFCDTSKCQDYFDSRGQLLYSLYGVVQHSGGMQGGHYTAYVKSRTPLKCDKQTLLSLTHPSSMNQKTPAIIDSKSTATECSTKSECESTSSVTDHQNCEPETTDEVVQTEIPEDNDTIIETDVVSDSKNDSSSVGGSNVDECPPVESDSGACADVGNNLNFDPSMKDGQWYYISDSHVTTASESEVLRCQAYLLFYERLPLQ